MFVLYFVRHCVSRKLIVEIICCGISGEAKRGKVVGLKEKEKLTEYWVCEMKGRWEGVGWERDDGKEERGEKVKEVEGKGVGLEGKE